MNTLLRRLAPGTCAAAAAATLYFPVLASNSSLDLGQEAGQITTQATAVGTQVFSMAFGSTRDGEGIRDIAIDAAGNFYITGDAEDGGFPTTANAWDRTYNGGAADAFVMKLAPNGSVLWSTLLGGPSLDRAYAIEVGPQGDVYISGRAGVGFPVTAQAFQRQASGGPATGPYPSQDGMVAKFSASGQLLWASYFGAIGDDHSHPVRDIAVGADGDVYLATSSTTGQFPANILAAFSRGFDPRIAGERDGAVARVSSDGRTVKWATYLGGRDEEWAEGTVRLTSTGDIYYLTATYSNDARVTAGVYDTVFNGVTDFYLARLTPNGQLVWATYLGGSDREHVETHELAVDANDNPIVAAGTLSTNFPTTAGAFRTRHSGNGGSGTGARTNYQGDGIIARLSADGRRLLASTYFGGRYGESIEGSGVDGAGNVYVGGATFSDNLPVTADAAQRTLRGGPDQFLARLSPDLTRLLYATYLGGSAGETGRALAVDRAGVTYVGGDTQSSDWSFVSRLAWATWGGGRDATLAKFAF